MGALIDVYKPEHWAIETLMQLFPRLRMANLMYRNFEGKVAQEGDTVNTRMPHKMVAQDVNPDSFTSKKPTADNVPVKMDKWKEVVFEIGDKEASLTLKDLRQEYFGPAAQGLAEAIEDACFEVYKDVPNFTGAAGTTPATVAALGTDIQQKFDELDIPDAGRYVVLNPAAQNKYNQVFYQDSVSGNAQQQTDGQLRQKFGMGYTSSNKLPKHTTGIAGTVLVAGAQLKSTNPAGSILAGTLAVDGMSANAKKGDLFSLNHATIGVVQYVITADTAHAGGVATLPIFPALKADIADDAPLTIIATHQNNLAFHQHAFALVSRPLWKPNAQGADVFVIDMDGIGIRSSIWYEGKDRRLYVSLDILFGVRTLDGRKAIRVLG